MTHTHRQTDTHTHLRLYFTRTTIPHGNITIFAFIPGTFWTIQHLTDTLVFKRPLATWSTWLSGQTFNIRTIIIFRRGGESNPVGELNREATLPTYIFQPFHHVNIKKQNEINTTTQTLWRGHEIPSFHFLINIICYMMSHTLGMCDLPSKTH